MEIPFTSLYIYKYIYIKTHTYLYKNNDNSETVSPIFILIRIFVPMHFVFKCFSFFFGYNRILYHECQTIKLQFKFSTNKKKLQLARFLTF